MVLSTNFSLILRTRLVLGKYPNVNTCTFILLDSLQYNRLYHVSSIILFDCSRYLTASDLYSIIKKQIASGNLTSVIQTIDKLVTMINDKTLHITLESNFSLFNMLDTLISSILSSTDGWIDKSRPYVAELLRNLKNSVAAQISSKRALATTYAEDLAETTEALIQSVLKLAGNKVFTNLAITFRRLTYRDLNCFTFI
jgi:hypothetical protein